MARVTPTTYTLGYVDQLKVELTDRIGGLEAAVVELGLLRAGLAALGGPAVPEDPRDVQHRKDADRVSKLEDRNRSLVAANSQLESQVQAFSAGSVEPDTALRQALESAVRENEELHRELTEANRERTELMAVRADLEAKLGKAIREHTQADTELRECRRKCAELQPDGSPDEPAEKTPAVLLTDERTRDYVLSDLKDEPFSTAVIAEHFGVSIPTARRRLTSLARQDIIRRPAGTPVRGSHARWEYNADIPASPREKPRGERLLGVPSPRRSGGPIPGTGVPHGPAETPGKLKRQQAKAPRVQHKPVKGVRV